jgi:flagellar motility protein MotE (MotC chaperone)
VNIPRLKAPRLLPIVIFAAAALLIFKAVGLMTDGGYVLTGTEAVRAADAAPKAADGPASTGADAPAADGADAAEPTMTDSSPTLTDTAPMLASLTEPDKPGGEKKTAPPAAPPGPDAAAQPGASAAGSAPLPPCPPGAPASTAAAGPATCMPADAMAMKADANGKPVPMADVEGAQSSAAALLQRLAERRAELDKREQALNMREAIVAAAEKQMAERADALKALESQIAALSDQKKSMEDEQFSGIVKMYEAMKPQEAASIFDGLDMNVLLRVAKAMDPRKMSPILAKMSAARAQQLTVEIAADNPQMVAAAPQADPNALPQIVGH